MLSTKTHILMFTRMVPPIFPLLKIQVRRENTYIIISCGARPKWYRLNKSFKYMVHLLDVTAASIERGHLSYRPQACPGAL